MTTSGWQEGLTVDKQFAGVINGGRFVGGDTTVIAVMVRGQVGDDQGERELVDLTQVEVRDLFALDDSTVFGPLETHGLVALGHVAIDTRPHARLQLVVELEIFNHGRLWWAKKRKTVVDSPDHV